MNPRSEVGSCNREMASRRGYTFSRVRAGRTPWWSGRPRLAHRYQDRDRWCQLRGGVRRRLRAGCSRRAGRSGPAPSRAICCHAADSTTSSPTAGSVTHGSNWTISSRHRPRWSCCRTSPTSSPPMTARRPSPDVARAWCPGAPSHGTAPRWSAPERRSTPRSPELPRRSRTGRADGRGYGSGCVTRASSIARVSRIHDRVLARHASSAARLSAARRPHRRAGRRHGECMLPAGVLADARPSCRSFVALRRLA